MKVAIRYFSKKTINDNIKSVNPITKLQHVKLDLPKMLAPNMVPLIRQNIINRKANYADVDIVLLGFLLIVGETVCNESMLLGFKLTDGESVCSILAFVGTPANKAAV